MKINIEVDLTPEELRRLVGLPDAQPYWDAINERIANGDTEMLSQMLKRTVGLSENFSLSDILNSEEGEELRTALRTAVGDSFKPSEIVSRVSRGFGLFRRDTEVADEAAAPKKPAKKKAAARKKRPARKKKPQSKA